MKALKIAHRTLLGIMIFFITATIVWITLAQFIVLIPEDDGLATGLFSILLIGTSFISFIVWVDFFIIYKILQHELAKKNISQE